MEATGMDPNQRQALEASTDRVSWRSADGQLDSAHLSWFEKFVQVSSTWKAPLIWSHWTSWDIFSHLFITLLGTFLTAYLPWQRMKSSSRTHAHNRGNLGSCSDAFRSFRSSMKQRWVLALMRRNSWGWAVLLPGHTWTCFTTFQKWSPAMASWFSACSII